MLFSLGTHPGDDSVGFWMTRCQMIRVRLFLLLARKSDEEVCMECESAAILFG